MNTDDDKLPDIFSATSIIDRLREELRVAEIKIAGLESEIEDLKGERDQLRARVAELTSAAVPAEKPKRGRGRPPGSKNKPKAVDDGPSLRRAP